MVYEPRNATRLLLEKVHFAACEHAVTPAIQVVLAKLALQQSSRFARRHGKHACLECLVERIITTLRGAWETMAERGGIFAFKEESKNEEWRCLHTWYVASLHGFSLVGLLERFVDEVEGSEAEVREAAKVMALWREARREARMVPGVLYEGGTDEGDDAQEHAEVRSAENRENGDVDLLGADFGTTVGNSTRGVGEGAAKGVSGDGERSNKKEESGKKGGSKKTRCRRNEGQNERRDEKEENNKKRGSSKRKQDIKTERTQPPKRTKTSHPSRPGHITAPAKALPRSCLKHTRSSDADPTKRTSQPKRVQFSDTATVSPAHFNTVPYPFMPALSKRSTIMPHTSRAFRARGDSSSIRRKAASYRPGRWASPAGYEKQNTSWEEESWSRFEECMQREEREWELELEAGERAADICEDVCEVWKAMRGEAAREKGD